MPYFSFASFGTRRSQGGKLLYSDKLAATIRNADAVVCLSAVGAGIKSLQDDSLPIIGVSRALSDAHKAGAKFVLLSDNLPVDAARFQDADAIVCAYLSAGVAWTRPPAQAARKMSAHSTRTYPPRFAQSSGQRICPENCL